MHPGFLASKAFTLAEVLITLGIIGVVAALTLPTLIQNYKEKATVTALKKSYSILSQAYERVELEYDNPVHWNLTGMQYADPSHPSTDNISDSGSADEVLERFAKYMNVSKFCKAADKDCMEEISYTYLSNAKDPNHWRGGMFSTAILADGSIIYFYVGKADCSLNYGQTNNVKACGNFYVDLNGYKTPNRRGEDLFEFLLTSKGILPSGYPDFPSNAFENSCSDAKTMKGFGCTAWVLQHENLDYLRKSDLSL